MEQSYAEANAKKKTTGSVIALKIILIILVILVFLAAILISISTKISINRSSSNLWVDLVLAEIPCGMGICIL